MTDRIAGTVLMGLDVAVEFATLGEFRLVEADASDASASASAAAAPLVRRPARLDGIGTNQSLLPPASTAIARAAAESAARATARRSPARPPLKRGERAVIPSAPRRRPASPQTRKAQPVRKATPDALAAMKPAPRKRAGAVDTGSQLCLFGR